MELDGAPDVQGQRARARPRRRARRVRAGLELRRADRSRLRARADRVPPRRALPQQPQRHRRARRRRRDLLHRPRLRPLERLDRPGAQPRARLPRRLPHPARAATARRAARAPRTSSTSPTASASRPTSRCSTSTTPTTATSRSSTSRADGTLGPARIFAEGIGVGFSDDDSDAIREARHQELHDAGAVDGMKCDELGNVWVTGPGRRLGAQPGRRAARPDPRARGRRQPDLGRRRPAHAVPDDLDDRPQPADARRGRAARPPPLMDALEELVAKEAIRDLLARYPMAFDDRDWDAWEALWTEDVVWVVDGDADRGARRGEGVHGRLPAGGLHRQAPLRAVGDRGRPRRRDRARAAPTSSGSPRTTTTRSSRATSTTLVKRDGRWRISRREEVTVPYRAGAAADVGGLARAERRHDAKGRRWLITSTSC